MFGKGCTQGDPGRRMDGQNSQARVDCVDRHFDGLTAAGYRGDVQGVFGGTVRGLGDPEWLGGSDCAVRRSDLPDRGPGECAGHRDQRQTESRSGVAKQALVRHAHRWPVQG